MKRLSAAGMLELGATLTDQERTLMETVANLHLVSHEQARRILGFSQDPSGQRMARRLLARLTDAAVLARLDRRIGGLRAGSAGYSYHLGPAGQRLIAYLSGRGLVRGRTRPEPGGPYVRHRLAVSEIYVQVLEAERSGSIDVLALEIEPGCWRSFSDGLGGKRDLKPDAFVRVGVGAYEESSFIEVDLATESLNVVSRKLRTYVDYFHSGTEQAAHAVFPRVVWVTASEHRRQGIVERCGRLPAEVWPLFAVTTFDHALEVLTGGLMDDQTEAETEALS